MATDSFNLEAFRASEAEQDDDANYFRIHLGTSKDAEGNPVEDFIRFPPIRKWPLKAQTRFGEGNVIEGIQLLAGEEASALFDQYNWTLGEFEALFDALSKWSGFQMGQPSAPQPPRGLTRMSSLPSSAPTEST